MAGTCYPKPAAVTVIAILMVAASYAAEATVDDDRPPTSGMRQHAMPLGKFVQLKAGMTRPDVAKFLGKVGEHQFTNVDNDGTVWQCEEYAIAKEPEFASSAFQLLYNDGELYSITDSEDTWWHYKALIGVGRGEIEDRGKQKKRLERTPIAEFDDDAQILEYFRVKSVRGEEIKQKMPELQKHVLSQEEDHKARDKRNPPDPGLTLVFGVINAINPSIGKEMDQAFKTNSKCITNFDGGKIKIGMTKDEVECLFGPPLLQRALPGDDLAAIYGPKDTTEIAKVEPYLMCRPVLVLYRDGAVVRVLSNFFFSSDWQDMVWPELKSP